MVTVTLAVAKTFMESLARLPKKEQKRAREFIEDYQRNPTNPGTHFETLPGMKDPKLRSAKLSDAYRVILVAPPKGDVMLCVWVDHHDEAYRWAERKTFEVNPRSGVFQVYSVEEGAEAVAQADDTRTTGQAYEAPALFARLDDEELLLAGVPQPLLPAVRELTYEPDLDALAPHLPADAADMLYLLASGYSFLDALEEASRPGPDTEPVDTEDVAAALERPESQQTFRVVEGEAELEAMLDAPLEQWRVFLHPSQRRIVEWDVKGPIRVLGGAGTGKTVVLLHRARHLASRVFTDSDDRILVTTFTRSLAADLESALRSLCPEHVDRIEVRNLHAWSKQFYEQRVGSRILVATPAQRNELMARAAAEAGDDTFSEAFYFEEWERVVQAQGIRDESAYLKAKRTGRGTQLGRAQRRRVWAVFDTYIGLLREQRLLEWSDIVREARLFLEKQSPALPYRAVLADEVQDLSPQEVLLLRAIVPRAPNDMFLVGDAHQRIYGSMARLGACGVEIRGRARRLRINYRTTEQIRNRAIATLEGLEVDDLDGGVDSLRGYRSLRAGPEPQVHLLDHVEDEHALIVTTICRWLESVQPADICVAARTNEQVELKARAIREAGIDVHVIGREKPETSPGVRVATMHRLKGLEFRCVLLAAVQDGAVPLLSHDHADSASREDREKQERCLFYVASTRARDELVITGAGRASAFVAG